MSQPTSKHFHNELFFHIASLRAQQNKNTDAEIHNYALMKESEFLNSKHGH
jgi:hypothetical protein